MAIGVTLRPQFNPCHVRKADREGPERPPVEDLAVVIVFYKDFESHLERLAEGCQHFQSVELKLQPEKCHLFQREVHYLDHVVSQHGVATDLAKIAAVKGGPLDAPKK